MSQCGVYVLIKDWDVIYIGTSSDPKHRIKTHSIKDFDHYVIIDSNEEYRRWLEAYLISEQKPRLNKSGISAYISPISKKHLRNKPNHFK